LFFENHILQLNDSPCQGETCGFQGVTEEKFMLNRKLYFTQRGLAKLHQDIEKLEGKLRELQLQTTEVAETGGDQWHDNPGYDSLVIDIRGIDRRLSDAHQCLNQAILVKLPINLDKVAIGVRVKIFQDGEETILEIVGFGESDPDQDMLAYNTPLASLIMGRGKGEVVSGIIVDRQTEIKILEISKGGGECS